MSAPTRLAPGESTQRVDAVTVAKNVYRGGMWELIGIGKPVPAIAMAVLLVLLVVFAIVGLPWPSIIFSALLVAVAIWTQRSVVRWAEEHNARVAPLNPPTGSRVPRTGPSKPKAAPRRRPNRAGGRSPTSKRDRP